MINFGENLRYFREGKGISQRVLAERLGVSYRTVMNYETGKTMPSMETVVHIAHILSVSCDQLLGYNVLARYITL